MAQTSLPNDSLKSKIRTPRRSRKRGPYRNLVGQVFGELTVTAFTETRNGQSYYLCACSCGKEKPVRGSHLTDGSTQSCGCRHFELIGAKKRTHGQSRTNLHAIWRSARARCRNPKHPGYEHYGGRGIEFCERWDSFENFATDMGERPSPTHSIERKNNDGNYCPENCVWATPVEQTNNRRLTVRVEYHGKIQALSPLCAELGLRYGTVYKRLGRGWSLERALTTPMGGCTRSAGV